MKSRLAVVFGCVVIASSAAAAHHTVARTFDVSHAVALAGIVTSVQWQYPHVIYHLSVHDERGGGIDWEIESRHPQGMHLDGIEMDTIKVGDVVTMNVLVALDGSRRAATASVTLPSGRTVRICTVTENRCP